MSTALESQEVRVRGTVQGVGFRPTVYRLAKECQLTGEVSNDTDGVLMQLSGVQKNIQQFLHRLQIEAPPLAKIDSIEASIVQHPRKYNDFRISQSRHTNGRTEIAADAKTCNACLNEIVDPNERRYLYPFTNCTHCGPRLSIIQGIPYDRGNTTMADFPLCTECLKEYSNPTDRRFHAQPIACHQCGPQLLLHSNEPLIATNTGTNEENSFQKLQHINEALNAGKIVAIKGLGGFHLCCDATNHEAVKLLRMRKQRYAKPFALMFYDINAAYQYCHISELEKEVLLSVAAPIVLLKANQQLENNISLQSSAILSSAIAPGSDLLGVMLPYTPLHYLISRQFSKPLVMTSGNLSGEPQIIDNDEAIEKLSAIADLIVYHDRSIANRIDDSVVRCVSGHKRIMRRARGYAPQSIQLPDGFHSADKILAYGAELKSTFCLIKKGVAILSQHQGDLEDITTFSDYEKNLELYKTLFEFEAEYIAYDMHPEYLSSKRAKQDVIENNLTAVEIQHHHAHIASAMAENKLPLTHPAVLGVALDGLGFGDNGTLWGGEFLLADYCSYQRVARFKPIALPGGSQAIKQPWRNTYAHILNSMSWDSFSQLYGNTSVANLFGQKPVTALETMFANQLNCPSASSTGRLFDAVAGALACSADEVNYEGQAAIELEMLANAEAVLSNSVSRPYQFTIEQPLALNTYSNTLLNLDACSIWPELLTDLQLGESRSLIASRFHAGLINGVMNMIDILVEEFLITDVVLSGGCMQNAILLQGLEQALKKRQLNCITHSLVPANDGGIALGQAVISAARIISKKV